MRESSQIVVLVSILAAIAAPASGCGGTGSNAADGGAAAGPDGGATGIHWKGVWSVRLQYTAKCDIGFGNYKTSDQDFTETMTISGSNAALEADTEGYAMSGTGDAAGMMLSGRYPIRNNTGDAASNDPDNHVTFKLDTVAGENDASGTVEASFRDLFNNPCTAENGKAAFSR